MRGAHQGVDRSLNGERAGGGATQEDIYLTNVYTFRGNPPTTTISYKALTGAPVCLCACTRVCEPFVLLHLKRPSGSVNSVHHSPGVCEIPAKACACLCVLEC